MDQRGFGDSDRPNGGYPIDVFAVDAVAVLDTLSIHRATLVGHSFGTLVARQAAITRPERIARMVLIGTGVSKDNPVLQDVQAAMADLKDPEPVEFAREFQASTAYAPLPESFFERIATESLKPPRGSRHALLKEYNVPLQHTTADLEDDLQAQRELGILPCR